MKTQRRKCEKRKTKRTRKSKTKSCKSKSQSQSGGEPQVPCLGLIEAFKDEADKRTLMALAKDPKVLQMYSVDIRKERVTTLGRFKAMDLQDEPQDIKRLCDEGKYICKKLVIIEKPDVKLTEVLRNIMMPVIKVGSKKRRDYSYFDDIDLNNIIKKSNEIGIPVNNMKPCSVLAERFFEFSSLNREYEYYVFIQRLK